MTRAVTRYKFLAQSGNALRYRACARLFFAAVRAVELSCPCVRALENYFPISANVRALDFFFRALETFPCAIKFFRALHFSFALENLRALRLFYKNF